MTGLRQSGGVTSALPVLLLLALLLGLAAVAAPGPAAALPRPGDAILVEVTEVSPQFPQPGDDLTVRGTVSNQSGQQAVDLQALLRISPEALSSRSDVGLVTDQQTGRRGLTQTQTQTPITDSLPPASSTDFAITAPVDDLPLSSNGVYAVFVEVRVSGIGSFDTVFPLTWFPQPDAVEPSQMVVLTHVRAAVDMTANKNLRSPALASSMAPGGTLNTLVTGAADAADADVPISWLIDPAVSEAATDLASGEGTFPEAATDPSAAEDTMADFVATLARATTSASAATTITPYAEVDASGVLAAGMPSLLTESIALANASVDAQDADDPLAAARGVLAAGPDGNTTTAALRAYNEAGVGTILLDQSAVPPVEQLPYSPSGVAAIPLPNGSSVTGIVPDDLLREDLQRPARTPAEQFRMRQGLLADAAMITLELPQRPRSVVLSLEASRTLTPQALSSSLIALHEASFIDVVGLSALLEPDVPRVERRLVLDEDDVDRLPEAYFTPIPALEQRLVSFARVTVDPLAFERDYFAAMLRSASANWRSDQARGESLLDSIAAELSEEEQKVTTVSTGTVTFSGSSGSLPLTISNELEQAVEVNVELAAQPSIRLAFQPPGLVLVDPGKRVSVEIPVEVFGSGPLPVTVILTDRDGNPFIETGDLVIRSAATTLAAAVVAIIAAVALITLVIWRFRKQRKADS